MRYKILSVLAAALLVNTACGDLTSVNTNPNGPTDVPPPSILPNALQAAVNGTIPETVGIKRKSARIGSTLLKRTQLSYIGNRRPLQRANPILETQKFYS